MNTVDDRAADYAKKAVAGLMKNPNMKKVWDGMSDADRQEVYKDYEGYYRVTVEPIFQVRPDASVVMAKLGRTYASAA